MSYIFWIAFTAHIEYLLFASIVTLSVIYDTRVLPHSRSTPEVSCGLGLNDISRHCKSSEGATIKISSGIEHWGIVMGHKKHDQLSLRVGVLVLLALFPLLNACSDSSSNSVDNSYEGAMDPVARVYVSRPDTLGRVIVVSSQGFVSEAGTIVGRNITKEVVSAAAQRATTQDCLRDESPTHEDGSFVNLSLCADVGDSIGLALFSGGVEREDLGEYIVPAATQETCDTEERAFTVTNNSSQEIWLGVTAGTLSCLTDSDCPTEAAGSCVGADSVTSKAGSCGCPTNSECGSVAQCNTRDNFCYWNPPALSVGQMKLGATKGQSLLCFPAPETGQNIQWSGNMFARTGCNATGQQCATGDCGSKANKNCPTGTGGNPPNTLLEFTLSNQSAVSIPGPDFYDISIINGINVAASFVPAVGTYKADSSDPYSCAGPGSATQAGSLSPCAWQVNPTVSDVDYTSLLRNVTPTAVPAKGQCPKGGSPNALGNCECESDSDCSAAEQVCGLALNAQQDQQYTQVCGTHIGWWSADQICGSSINNVSPFVPFGMPLNCADTVINSDGSSSTNTNLYICTQPATSTAPEQAQSCYSTGAVSDCCGCATSAAAEFQDWPSVLSPSFGGSDNGCYNNNPKWISIVQPWLVFLKQACPTAYTYPFDDATSTFTCEGVADSVGPPSYDLRFFDTQ